MIILSLICILGDYWAKNYYNFSEEEVYEYGLVGIFFARIFGNDWLE